MALPAFSARPRETHSLKCTGEKLAKGSPGVGHDISLWPRQVGEVRFSGLIRLNHEEMMASWSAMRIMESVEVLRHELNWKSIRANKTVSWKKIKISACTWSVWCYSISAIIVLLVSLGAFDICTKYPLSVLVAIKEHEAHILLALGVHLEYTHWVRITGFVWRHPNQHAS